MALESLPKIAPALFSAEQDLIQIYNKKTDTTGVINASLLGGSTPPSGVSGAIQFSTGSAFGSDSANLFWDDINKRLGVNTNAPNFPVDVVGEIRSTTQVSAGASGINGVFAVRRTSDGNVIGTFAANANEVVITEFTGQGGRLDTGYATTALKWIGTGSQPRVGIGFNGSVLATTHIKGSGSTSATTSLLVQNSAGTASFQIKDDGNSYLGQFNTASGNNVLDQFTAKLFTLTNAFVSHSVGSTYNGSTGDSSLALCGLGVGGGFFGGIRMFTSSSSATPVLAMIVDRNQSVGIGLTNSTDLTVNASAKLQVDSTTKGFLPPRMTTTQKNAIASPAAGLVVYDSTTNKLQCYNGSTWNDLF